MTDIIVALIVVLVIYLAQLILAVFRVPEPGRTIVLILVVIGCLIWALRHAGIL